MRETKKVQRRYSAKKRKTNINHYFPRQLIGRTQRVLITTKSKEMLVHEVKTSSRVTAPPGGCSSISLSFAPHNKDEKVKTRVNARSKEADYSQYEEEIAKEGEKRVTTTGGIKISPQTVGHSRSSPCTSSNAYASGSRMNSGNVLTGRPTSRVLAPPGGRSSFRLG